MGDKQFNLVLISRPEINDFAEFQRLGKYVEEIDPAIRTFVTLDRRLKPWQFLRKQQLKSAATLVFSPARIDRFKAPRGKVFAGKPLSKSEEMDALKDKGVSVPDYVKITQDNMPDLAHLGSHVVVKPDKGGRGANVTIMRRGRVKWKPSESRVSGKSDVMVAQQFIYTGQWPISYRVTTLFGQVLWSDISEATHDRRPLPSKDFSESPGGISIVATGNGCIMKLSNDMEVIRFAEAAHAAFPDHPLLGIDVIREQPSGKLYVLEVNSSGYVWHFSSPLGVEFQRDNNFNLESQFDGIRKAARILAGITRKEAL